MITIWPPHQGFNFLEDLKANLRDEFTTFIHSEMGNFWRNFWIK